MKKPMKEHFSLVGVDGNAFAIMGYVCSAFKACGVENLRAEYQENAMSGNYDHLLAVSQEYITKCNRIAAGLDSAEMYKRQEQE